MSSEREMRYRQAQRERGLAHVRVWVPKDRADELKSIARTMCEEHKESKP